MKHLAIPILIGWALVVPWVVWVVPALGADGAAHWALVLCGGALIGAIVTLAYEGLRRG